MNDDIEKQKKQKRVRLIIQIIVIILLLAMAVGFTIYLLPIFVRIQKDEAFRNTVVEYISRLGKWSWIALIFIQVIHAKGTGGDQHVCSKSFRTFHDLVAHVLCHVFFFQ